MLREQVRDRVAGGVAEELERPRLRSHELELDVCARVGEVNGRQQRELVERERPRDPGRHGEDEPAHGPFSRLSQHLAERRLVARAAKRDGAGNGRHRAGAEREQEEVVAQLAGRGLD